MANKIRKIKKKINTQPKRGVYLMAVFREIKPKLSDEEMLKLKEAVKNELALAYSAGYNEKPEHRFSGKGNMMIFLREFGKDFYEDHPKN